MSTVRMYELIKKTSLPPEEAEALVEEIEKLVNQNRAAGRFDDRKELLATKIDLAQLETRLIRWTVGTGIGVCGIVIAAVKYL